MHGILLGLAISVLNPTPDDLIGYLGSGNRSAEIFALECSKYTGDHRALPLAYKLMGSASKEVAHQAFECFPKIAEAVRHRTWSLWQIEPFGYLAVKSRDERDARYLALANCGPYMRYAYYASNSADPRKREGLLKLAVSKMSFQDFELPDEFWFVCGTVSNLEETSRRQALWTYTRLQLRSEAVRMLRNRRSEPRTAWLAAVEDLPGSIKIEDLQGDLRSPISGVRAAALRAAASLFSDRAFELLESMVQDPNAGVRRELALVTRHLSSDHRERILRSLLADRNESVQSLAKSILESTATEQSIISIRVSGSPDPNARVTIPYLPQTGGFDFGGYGPKLRS